MSGTAAVRPSATRSRACSTAQGFAVHREFYYNDAGAQIMNLALSVQARIREAQGIAASFPDDGYQGEYIREIARDYAAAQS